MTQRERYLHHNKASLAARLKYRYSRVKAGARKRNIQFDLTFDQFYSMWLAQAGRCAYTMKRMYTTYGKGYQWRDVVVSVDRLDPSKSYNVDNCLLVRYEANRQKARMIFNSQHFLERFRKWANNAVTIYPQLLALTA